MTLILNTYLRFHGFQKPEVSNSIQTEPIIANDVLTAVHFSVCMLLRHADGLKCIFFFCSLFKSVQALYSFKGELCQNKENYCQKM